MGEASCAPPVIRTHAAFQNLPRPVGKSLCARSQPPHDARWSIVGRVGPSQVAAHAIARKTPADPAAPPPPPTTTTTTPAPGGLQGMDVGGGREGTNTGSVVKPSKILLQKSFLLGKSALGSLVFPGYWEPTKKQVFDFIGFQNLVNKIFSFTRLQGSHPAHLWATCDFAPRSEAVGPPKAAGVM